MLVIYCLTPFSLLQGGALGVICNTPFDVVKSRMQDITQKVPYTGIISSLRRIVDQEGLPALYKGLKPRVFRLGLGGGIMMYVDCFKAYVDCCARSQF